jgi:hypothetical protein
MTLIKSAHLKGVRIGRNNAFDPTLPGLIMWCEADYGVTLSGNDILSIDDRSGFDNAIVGLSEPNRGQLVTISGVFKAMQNVGVKYSNIVNPATKGWDAIIRQRPFGIFSLVSRNNSGGGGLILDHTTGGPNLMRLLINSVGSVRHIFRNSNNQEINWGSANGVVSLNNTVHAVDLISYGAGNSPQFELFVNTSSVATRTGSNLTGLETVGTDLRVLHGTATSSRGELVMILVYDWTGYSVAQINSFRQQINNLREEKYGPIF